MVYLINTTLAWGHGNLGAPNATSSFIATDPALHWNALAALSLIFLIAGFSTNGAVLVAFIRQKDLLTSFNVYLLNLTIANFLYQVTKAPLDVVNNLYSTWWLGHSACNFYQYVQYGGEGAVLNAHALITLNRIWAAAHPLSYRNYHTKRLAVGFCVGMWIYIHINLLPGLIPDALYYRLPEAIHGCLLNAYANRSWSWYVQVAFYDVPEVVVIVAYPFVCYKWLKRRRMRNNRVTAALPHQVASGTGEVAIDDEARRKPQSEQRSFAFIMLTLLTVSALICWTPGKVYFTIITFGDFDLPLFRSIGIVLFSLEGVLDPVYFLVTLNPNAFKMIRQLCDRAFPCC